MSKWIGSVTPNVISLVRVGGGAADLLGMLLPLLLIAGGVALAVAFEAALNVVIGVIVTAIVVSLVARVALGGVLLDRAIAKACQGTEERYAALQKVRTALAEGDRAVADRLAEDMAAPALEQAPEVLVPTEIVADLPWDREPVYLDAQER